MIKDSFGVWHPTENDPITTEGLLHIANCGKCKGTYEGQITDYAVQVSEAWHRALEALAQGGSDGGR